MVKGFFQLKALLLPPLSAHRRLILVAVAVGLVIWAGPSLVRSLLPPTRAMDSFQDWASARNYFENRPIYTAHAITFPLYTPWGPERQFLAINGHPPVSVLSLLPLGLLDYPVAHLIWNAVSLLALAGTVGLIVHQLRLRLSPGLLLAGLFLVLSYPMRQQLEYCTWSLILAFLVTAAWAADRSSRPWTAGTLLGIAAGIKLFPAFLFLYFLVRRQWNVLGAGLAAFAAVNLLAVGVFGAETYWHYWTEALPQLGGWRSEWHNCSLTGFWSRLFDPTGPARPVRALAQIPALSRTFILAETLLIAAATAVAAYRARTRPACDLAFGAALAAMVLVTLLAFDHYFFLLLMPLVLLGMRLPPGSWSRRLYWVIVALLWIKTPILWYVCGLFSTNGSQPTATPLHSLTCLSAQTYALCGLFLLLLRAVHGVTLDGRPEVTGSPLVS